MEIFKESVTGYKPTGSSKVYQKAKQEIEKLYNAHPSSKEFKRLRRLVDVFSTELESKKFFIENFTKTDRDFVCDITGKVFTPDVIASNIYELQAKTTQFNGTSDEERAVHAKNIESLQYMLNLYEFEEDETLAERFYFLKFENNCVHQRAVEALQHFMLEKRNSTKEFDTSRVKILLAKTVAEVSRKVNLNKRKALINKLK